ncbi:MAG TPA: helix-turn-helix domain-containing protein [Candidatus Thermoplasmatota archaeon]|nr:helix-turn-helix domain-containing protein [Candidatus Thermoplasmatota archaeon]
MRSTRTPTILGAALLGMAALLLFAGLGLALAAPADAPAAPAPAASAERHVEGGLDLAADVRVEVLGVEVERSADASPEAAASLPLPGFSVVRQERVAPEGVPVEADLGLDLQMGSHAEEGDEAPAETAVASAQATPVRASDGLVIAAAVAAGAGLLALAWGSLKSLGQRVLVLPAIALYAKVTRAEVFENEVRERIFAAIRDRPGIAATDLAREASVAWGTTIYHLDVLEQTQMVTSIREGRHRRYFLNGAQLPGSKVAVAILHNEVTRSVVDRVRAAPGATQKELAEATGMTPQALHWHLVRLVGAGLVRKEREGRVVRHFPAAA